MPLLDVSDAFDASFWDELTLKRTVETVNVRGRTTDVVTTSTFSGVVTAVSPFDLQVLPETERMNKAIQIYTQFRLQAGGPDHDPDIIHWHGTDFRVTQLEDFSGYGVGFIVVIAVSMSGTHGTV
jgi:hypothetical protein